jgi:hypothetical protein
VLNAQRPGFFIYDQPDEIYMARLARTRSDKIPYKYDIGVKFEH